MTTPEQQWLESGGTNHMLTLVKAVATERRLRLFAVACCCRILNLMSDEQRVIVEAAERLADAGLTLEDARQFYQSAVIANRGGIKRAGEAAQFVILPSGQRVFLSLPERHTFAIWTANAASQAVELSVLKGRRGGVGLKERKQQVRLLRDIFGNPFRPVAVDAAWLTSTVVQLARGIYEERAFDRMPILADALQDAGCDNDNVLTHCHDESATHVRGCWVVDLLLGKT